MHLKIPGGLPLPPNQSSGDPGRGLTPGEGDRGVEGNAGNGELCPGKFDSVCIPDPR